MHKLFSMVAVMGLIAGVSVSMAEESGGAPAPDGFAGIDAPAMTAGEMDETEGALFARFSRRSRRTRRYSWRNRASRTDRVHCDIIARNRAESMGYNTSTPSGAFRNYNNVTVSQIYSRHRSNRSSTPPRGTAGYIFTGGSSGKTHLQFYDARSGGSRYTRYSNRSYPGTESSSRVRSTYRPSNTARQTFVPLPRRDHRTVWYR
ncbi:MAG: hypothetical protein WD492_10270 [Alkalispirochaeta sp.]